jgi:hypothetical protein
MIRSAIRQDERRERHAAGVGVITWQRLVRRP